MSKVAQSFVTWNCLPECSLPYPQQQATNYFLSQIDYVHIRITYTSVSQTGFREEQWNKYINILKHRKHL